MIQILALSPHLPTLLFWVKGLFGGGVVCLASTWLVELRASHLLDKCSTA
jgi:hypothetical protein